SAGRGIGIGDQAAERAARDGSGAGSGRLRAGRARRRVRGHGAEGRAAAASHTWPRSGCLLLAPPDAGARDRWGGPRCPRRTARERSSALVTTLITRVVIGLMVLAVAAPALAQKRDKPADLSDSQRNLRETQKRLGEERAKAAQARKREASLLTELEAIDRRLTEKRRQIAALDARIQTAQNEIAGLKKDIARLENRRVGQEVALGRRLEALYKLQVEGGVLPVLLSGDDPLTRATRLRHLTTLATVDARLIR